MRSTLHRHLIKRLLTRWQGQSEILYKDIVSAHEEDWATERDRGGGGISCVVGLFVYDRGGNSCGWRVRTDLRTKTEVLEVGILPRWGTAVLCPYDQPGQRVAADSSGPARCWCYGDLPLALEGSYVDAELRSRNQAWVWSPGA